MAYKKIEQPIKSPEAFRDLEDEHVLSQASVLLLLGAQMEAAEPVSSAARVRSMRRVSKRVPKEYITRLNVPSLKAHTGKRIPPQRVRTALQRHSALFARPLTETPQDVIFGLARNLHKRKDLVSLSSLLEACLRHAHEVVRVAAALAYFHVSSEPARLLDIIEKGAASGESAVRDLARAALLRLSPGHPRLGELTQPLSRGQTGASPHTTLLVHGTFARNELWWRSGGDYYNYLLNDGVRPDLYAWQDPFEWTGGYSDADRAMAANDLQNWLAAHNIQNPYLITHSHGGSVAMLASQNGLDIGPLVLLSCPVHFPKYMPDFTRVGEIVSIHVKFDWVIFLDGGGQRFNHPKIKEIVLPVWFDHSATHDP
ncbi:MAG: alpha/beta fold hydrolase, partial [Candidatus Binatia bacterium]